MIWTLQKKVGIGFTFIILLLAGVGIGLYANMVGAIESANMVEHTHQVLERMKNTITRLTELESATRGYVITRDKLYLAPVDTATAAIDRNVAQLRDLTDDNAERQKQLDEFERLVRRKVTVSLALVKTREREGLHAAILGMETLESRRLMAMSRELASRMEAGELELLRLRREATKTNIQRTILFSIIGALMVLAALLVLYYLVNKETNERKKAERELRVAKDEAQTASRLKSEFLANMSHEIRTPMNGILGMTEITLNTDLTEDQRRYLEMVQSSGRALLGIINDILDFSKIEAGKMELAPVNFKFREAMAEIMHTFAQWAREKNLELLYQVNPDVPNYLIGDVSRLRQVVVNLVGNALKFTEQGEIFVCIDPESQSTDTVDLLFKISDTGIGLSEEQQRRIFDPFMQVDGSISRKYKGTGLGLSITLQLVELMGGRLWVESEEGQGSTFYFTVKLGIQHAPEETVIPIDVAKLKGMTVLIADDNHTNLQILKQMVLLWGMKPTLADNGQTGLDKMKEAAQSGQAFDLALVDYEMPGLDGFALAKEIKADAALKEAKVIMLSSYGHAGDIAQCRSLGIEGYLTKPIGQNELLSVIRTVFSDSGSVLAGGQVEKGLPLKHLAVGAGSLPMKILLAEDNEVNQAVAMHILEEAGHTVTLAVNGKEAVTQAREQVFDLVLMDVHMPEMDGFEATAAIRAVEKALGRHTPIIALTANAIKGDRERCLNAGMDGYIAKPFNREELLSTIYELNIHHDSDEAEGACGASLEEASSSDVEDVLDIERIQDRLGTDSAILQKIVGIFTAQYPAQLATLQDAVTKQDAKLLQETAHAIKGAIGNFTDKAAFKAALHLETLGREGDFSQAPAALAHLQAEVDRLLSALARLS